MPDEPELRVLLHEEQRHNHFNFVTEERLAMLEARINALEERQAAHEAEAIELVEEEDEPPNNDSETGTEDTGRETGDGDGGE